MCILQNETSGGFTHYFEKFRSTATVKIFMFLLPGTIIMHLRLYCRSFKLIAVWRIYCTIPFLL
jgi:uncharacterized integral membrane protein